VWFGYRSSEDHGQRTVKQLTINYQTFKLCGRGLCGTVDLAVVLALCRAIRTVTVVRQTTSAHSIQYKISERNSADRWSHLTVSTHDWLWARPVATPLRTRACMFVNASLTICIC